MRTTLTLDEDVAARLREEAQRTGLPFKVVVNQIVRLGLEARLPQASARKREFVWRDIKLEIGAPVVSTSELLERLEGWDRR